MSDSPSLHARLVHGRRVRVIGELLAPLVPAGARTLDVGCGDGRVGRQVLDRRPDLELRGVEITPRKDTLIPVDSYDGQTLPYPDASFDALIYVDVLHHSDEPEALLREALRVARQAVLIKDHLCDGLLARPTLSFMDRVGNRGFDMPMPHNYWRRDQWWQAFDRLGVEVDHWSSEVPLYPWPASLVFGRSLHFVARLRPARPGPPEPAAGAPSAAEGA